MSHKQKDVMFFFDSDDGKNWLDYWTAMFDVTNHVCKSTRDSETDIKLTLKRTTGLVLILSDKVVDFILETCWFYDLLKKQKVLCSLECHSFEVIPERILQLNNLKSYIADAESSTKNYEHVKDVLRLVDEEKNYLAKRKQTRAKKFRIFPQTVYKPNEQICITSKKTLSGKLEVAFGNLPKVDAKLYNPYTCVVLVPGDLPEGTTTVRFYMDGNIQGTHPLTLSLPSLAAFECPSFLCQILGIPTGDYEKLDVSLVEVFENSCPQDNSMQHIFTDYKDEKQRETELELPTILHFAAKYGLSNFCSQLMETPGSLEAFMVENKDGWNPADIAETSGHHDLGNYLQTLVETQVTANACEIYMDMTGFDKNHEKHSLCKEEEKNVEEETEDEESEEEMRGVAQQHCLGPPRPVRRNISNPEIHVNMPPRPVRRPSEPLKSNRSRQGTSEKPKLTAEQFFNMGPTPTLASYTTSSKYVEEGHLISLGERVKKGEISPDDACNFYRSWKDMNIKGTKTSLKIRQERLNTIIDNNKMFLKSVNDTPVKIGFLRRLKNKISTKQEDDFHPNITQNKKHALQLPSDPRLDRISAASGCSRESGISACSADTRDDSDLEDLEEHDGLEEEEEAVVSRRPSTGSRSSHDNRRSLLEDFTRKHSLDIPPPVPPRNYNTPKKGLPPRPKRSH